MFITYIRTRFEMFQMYRYLLACILLASISHIESLECSAGYTGEDGVSCTACGVDTFKTNIGEGSCESCPANSASISASINVTDCRCNAGKRDEVTVFNPPYAARSYSSIRDNRFNSLLDERNGNNAWSPITAQQNNAWMQFDTGTPMKIFGIITQPNIGNQVVMDMVVKYLRFGEWETVGTFENQERSRKENLFQSPVYAQYIRIYPKSFNVVMSMRAALIVQTCRLCPQTLGSVQSSVSGSACQCPSGTFKFISTANTRAMALVPGRAQFSTLDNRTSRTFAATAPYNESAGPQIKSGAITFDRGLNQYLDGGPQDFNVSTNGGFTAIIVCMFKTTSVDTENTILLGFQGANNERILMSRKSQVRIQLYFRNMGGYACNLWSLPEIVENQWLTIVATYTNATRTISIKIGDGDTQTSRCDQALVDIAISSTNVGISPGVGSPLLHGSIAGLYVVDALVDESWTREIIDGMYAGRDVLQSCQGCPVGSFKSESGDGVCTRCPDHSSTRISNSKKISDCKCEAGYSGIDGGECVPCATGTYKENLGSTCSQCQSGKYNAFMGSNSSSACVLCKAGKFHRNRGASSPQDCKVCSCK